MQTQKPDVYSNRSQLVRQALRDSDDTFKGGESPHRQRLGLRRPWMMGTSRLFKAPETGASSE